MTALTYCKADFAISQKFVEITLGFDEFYLKQKSDTTDSFLRKEGLVPVNLTDAAANSYENYEQVRQAYKVLLAEVNTIENELRREYMAKQILGMLYYVNFVSGQSASYRENVRKLLFVDPNPIFEAKVSAIHHQLDSKLNEAGYEGNLQQKYEAWIKARKVQPEQLEETLIKLLAESQKRVAEQMFPEVMDLQVVPKVIFNAPFSGYADYYKMEMLINGDYDYTYEGLKHLVTHEAFPGHFTHLYLRENAMKKKEIPIDSGLVITNSASSPIFEGIADCGQGFIGWIENIHDEINQLVQELKLATTMNAGFFMNELQHTDEQVSAYLKKYAFGQDEWIQSRISFLKDSIRGPFIYSYYRGYEELVHIVNTVPPHRREQFYDVLYKSMLTPSELKLY